MIVTTSRLCVSMCVGVCVRESVVVPVRGVLAGLCGRENPSVWSKNDTVRLCLPRSSLFSHYLHPPHLLQEKDRQFDLINPLWHLFFSNNFFIFFLAASCSCAYLKF